MAPLRPFGGGVHSWKAIITAIAVNVTVGSISAVYAASAQAQSAPMATANLADPLPPISPRRRGGLAFRNAGYAR